MKITDAIIQVEKGHLIYTKDEVLELLKNITESPYISSETIAEIVNIFSNRLELLVNRTNCFKPETAEFSLSCSNVIELVNVDLDLQAIESCLEESFEEAVEKLLD